MKNGKNIDLLERVDIIIKHEGGRSEVANKLNISFSAVNKWFAPASANMPSMENLWELSKISKCNFRWLIDGTGVPFGPSSLDEPQTDEERIELICKYFDGMQGIAKEDRNFLISIIKRLTDPVLKKKSSTPCLFSIRYLKEA